MSALRKLFTGPLLILIYWSWNLLFLSIVATATPGLSTGLALAAWQGELPWDLAAVALALLAAPFVAIAAGLAVRSDPARLFRLLFGVEIPLLIAGMVRLFLMREVTPGAMHLLLVVGAAGVAVTLDVLRRRAEPLPLGLFIGHAVVPLTALWVAAVLSFYVPAVAIGGWEACGWIARQLRGIDPTELAQLGQLVPVLLFWMVFLAFGAALFAVTPIAFFRVYVGTFARLFRARAEVAGRARTQVATAFGLLLCVAPAFVLNAQPQREAFARLDAAPADDAARDAILADEAALRAGLLNAYLGRYRYLTSSGETNHVEQMYDGYPFATAAQDLYDRLTVPFIYDGPSLAGDRDRADALYARAFDVPIQKGERGAVLRALNATWDRSTVEAGVLDVNGEKVLLARQEVTIDVDGDLATVRIDEEYRNETLEQQEIFYYFSLPESAAVTGLWLSDDPADPLRFPAVLAPRGAAQQVYLEQRRERRDPALLEQVGPRQYRLRAYPILQRRNTDALGPPLTVRFTYTTPVGAEGVPMPRLLERRNVHWDERSERFRAGDAWFPATTGEGATPRRHGKDLGNGLAVIATPVAERQRIPAGRRYAIVLDRSFSMRVHAEEAHRALEWIRAEVAPTNDVDLYATAGWGAGEPAFHDDLADLTPIRWFGSIEPHAMLAQYNALRGERTYDAVLVLTDEGSYDLAKRDAPPVPETAAPLWMVHVGGALAPAYDDALLEAIQTSHGGVAGSLKEVFDRLALWELNGDIVDGYVWSFEEFASGEVDGEWTGDAMFASIAARQCVLMHARTSDMAALENLDAAHRIAKDANIVTAYSSLLALVDEAQRRRLAALEEDEDRFAREAESGVESLTAPDAPLAVTAVPEPEEWALLILAGGLLVVLRRRSSSRNAHPGVPCRAGIGAFHARNGVGLHVGAAVPRDDG